MGDPAPLAAILADPADESNWLALARWFRDHGRDDEAAAVRIFWPTLRDAAADGRSMESVLADVRHSARILGDCARQIEGRAGKAIGPGERAGKQWCHRPGSWYPRDVQ